MAWCVDHVFCAAVAVGAGPCNIRARLMKEAPPVFQMEADMITPSPAPSPAKKSVLAVDPLHLEVFVVSLFDIDVEAEAALRDDPSLAAAEDDPAGSPHYTSVSATLPSRWDSEVRSWMVLDDFTVLSEPSPFLFDRGRTMVHVTVQPVRGTELALYTMHVPRPRPAASL